MALVEFYIKNFKQNGSTKTTETLFQSIPLADGYPYLKDPKVKMEMGKSGSFEFGMEPDYPLYDSMMQMKTILRVVYAGRTIFRGRVITIDKGMDFTRNVHCEGCFSYFLDSPQEGTKEDTRDTITVLAYLQQLINKHNEDVEAEKQITLGEVPGQYTSATKSAQRVKIPTDKNKQQFGSTSWNSTMDRLEDLLDSFGGYMRVRYETSDGKSYLDWLDKYFDASVNAQSIEVAKNLIDLDGTTEVENLFTILIPIGKNNSENVYISDYWPTASSGHAKRKYITVPELATLGLYTDDELNADYHRKSDYQNAITRYGKIWKTVDFENANTEEKLFAYAKDWIKNNYMPELTQWNVTALDLRTIDAATQPLYVGDRVKLTHNEVDLSYDAMTVIGAEYDLFNMEKTKYTIGIPNQLLNATYGVKQKQQTSSGGGGGGGGGGGQSQKPPTTDDTDEKIAKLRAEMMRQYSLKTDYGQDITLDDPLAFLVYNEKGEKLPAKEAMEKVKPYTADLVAGFKRYENPVTLAADAKKYGLDPNDPKTKAKLAMIYMQEKNPNLAKQQSDWKKNVEKTMINELGLDAATTNVLLNEKAGSVNMANYVDDDGNWTDNAPAWVKSPMANKEMAEKLRQEALQTRKLLSGQDALPPGVEIVNGIKQYIVGQSMNLSNFLNFDGDDLTFDLGALFNVDGIRNIFKLISNALSLDGENGTATVGVDANGNPKIALNKEITYTDADGKKQTIGGDGVIGASDFNVPEIPSFRTKFAAFDTLFADQAYINSAVIGRLEVVEGITAKSITTDNLATHLESVGFLGADTITCRGSLNVPNGPLNCGGTLKTSGLTLGSTDMGRAYVSLSVSGDTVTLTRANGDTSSFSKPEEVNVQSNRTASYTSNGTKTITPQGNYDAMAKVTVTIAVTTSGGSCFAAGSMVRLADGSERPIETLTPGLILAAYDPEQGEFCETEIMSLKQFKHRDDVFELELEDRRILVLTDSHPLYTREGWKSIDPEKTKVEEPDTEVKEKLTVNDSVLCLGGNYVGIKRIEYREDLTDCTVYNLDVEEVDTYIVNGVVTHNVNEKN